MRDLPEFSADTNFSNPNLRLLCLSNGHGEDIIAVRILQELQQRSPTLHIEVLPLVGEGRAYTQLGIPLIGSVKTMPSGGFIYMDGRQFVRDLQGGLLQLTLAQLRAVRSWVSLPQAQPGCKKAILAVGDIVPLLFAYLSGTNYAFVGTAKSEYYVRDEVSILPRRSLFERLESWSGSVYLPWERWLMSHPRCQAVFPRDSLTAQILQKWSIPAFDLGNPMMDRLEPVESTELAAAPEITILLLPGSRSPEAYANWEQILIAVKDLIATLSDRQLLFLGAIAPSLNLELLSQSLVNAGFQYVDSSSWCVQEADSIQNPKSKIQNWEALTFNYKNASLILSQHAYNDYLHKAEIAIAMAGTATEQFVGLGKPAITFPGKGPQFTYKFAEAQSRHLGPSIVLVENPQQVANVMQNLLSDFERLKVIAENGIKRMGKPGAAERIAQCLIKKLT